MALPQLINGQAYSWSMIGFNFSNLSGSPVVGVSKVSYSLERKLEHNYGAGDEPVSRGYGNKTYEGAVTLQMEEIERLRSVSSDGTMLGLGVFDLVVSYTHPEADKTVIVTLKNCEFNGQGVDVSQDDSMIEYEFQLNPAKIEFGDDSVI